MTFKDWDALTRKEIHSFIFLHLSQGAS